MNFKINESEQKLRGGYYTPLDLAQYISDWVILSKTSGPILEPSCGDGVFIEALSKTGKKLTIHAHELISSEAQKVKKKKFSNIFLNMTEGDFLKWANDNYQTTKESYSGVVGNPPFIRYQYMEKTTQSFSEEIFKKSDIPFTKHTNCWVPFFIASVNFLKQGGRCGMIVPTEIMHISHSQGLRTFLSKTCRRIFIIDPKDIWFENTLQGVCIIFLEKKNYPDEKCEGISIMPVEGKSFLETPAEKFVNNATYINGSVVSGKWTKALLTREERLLLDRFSKHKNVHKFNDIAKVDVGIVTGANSFFLVSNEVISKYELEKWAHPMFGRSEHCPGIIYDKKQHKLNQQKGLPTNFLWLDENDSSKFSSSVNDYLNYGLSLGLPYRYKCGIRTPWYKVPSVYHTNIGMLKRSHNFPKLIYNPLKAYTTDTAYRISLKKDICPQNLVASFVNSATALSAELEGRYYGGGVLELVPSEIEKLFIVADENIHIDIQSLNDDIQSLSASEILKKQDSIILKALGFSKKEQEILYKAWQRLSRRRQRLSD